MNDKVDETAPDLEAEPIKPPAENSDPLALKAQADLERFFSRVVHPSLASLQPEAVTEDAPKNVSAFLDIARLEAHNALCAEARRAFALTMGAAFERHLRLWLGARTPVDRATVQRQTGWPTLAERISSLVSTDFVALAIHADIQELWLLVSAIRRGDGFACNKLQDCAPHLWSHLTNHARNHAHANGALSFEIQIPDADLSRYAHALLAVWGLLGASRLGDGNGNQGYYVPIANLYQVAPDDGSSRRQSVQRGGYVQKICSRAQGLAGALLRLASARQPLHRRNSEDR